MASHTPWRKAPLQEAVFEIRFPPMSDYAIFVGGMAASLRGKFPIVEKLETAELPEFMQIQGLVRHRFSSKDKSVLFQTGSDVVSVNAVSYSGFDSFSKAIQDILVAAKEFISKEEIVRLGIRYINRFDEVSKISSVLKVETPFPDMEDHKTKEVLLRYVKQEDEDITTTINVSLNSKDKTLFLDIDAFYDSPQMGWNVDSILAWSSKAHGFVYDDFERLVSLSQKKERQ